MKLKRRSIFIVYTEQCMMTEDQSEVTQQPKKKTMSIRTARVQEMIHDEQALRVEWLETTKLISDLNTKILPRQQFEYLRNVMNGYALAMEKYPEWFESRKLESKMIWSTFYSQEPNDFSQNTSRNELEEFFHNL